MLVTFTSKIGENLKKTQNPTKQQTHPSLTVSFDLKWNTLCSFISLWNKIANGPWSANIKSIVCVALVIIAFQFCDDSKQFACLMFLFSWLIYTWKTNIVHALKLCFFSFFTMKRCWITSIKAWKCEEKWWHNVAGLLRKTYESD